MKSLGIYKEGIAHRLSAYLYNRVDGPGWSLAANERGFR